MSNTDSVTVTQSAFTISGLTENNISFKQDVSTDSVQNGSAYVLPSKILTQSNTNGITFDFNDGCRVQLPQPEKGKVWHIQIRDLQTNNILYEHPELSATVVQTTKKWFVQFGIKVWSRSVSLKGKEKSEETLILDYCFNLDNQTVLIQFPMGTLGDTLAWMTYAGKFAEKHSEAKIICIISSLILPLFVESYPNIAFMTPDELVAKNIQQQVYATYYLGLFFKDVECNYQPTDFRLVGLHKTAAYILGVSPNEEPAKILFEDQGRPIKEPYVCIAVQASTQCKQWNNPIGWIEVIDYLKAKGYRVICIDKQAVGGQNINWNYMPFNAENQTGDRPLAERARWLKHAEFFIGTSSGLTWLAWSVGVRIVLISGFTHPTNEFYTPYRVMNWHTCNSCWNDPKENFDHQDFLWCPKHKNTSRQFECSKLITAQLVINQINQIINQE